MKNRIRVLGGRYRYRLILYELTLDDRKSRLLLSNHISGKAAAEIEEGMVALLIALLTALRRSVTPDCGKNSANHPQISIVLDDMRPSIFQGLMHHGSAKLTRKQTV